MNLIFTCGGTAGHINPAIAVAKMMEQLHPGCKILFIGASGRMEEKLVPQAGYEIKCLPGSGLSRKLNVNGIKQNVRAVKCVFDALRECKRIFKEFKPDVVIGTGGYASFPALYAAQSMGIPTCVHESNALPGITTKMAAKKADKVLVAFEESVRHYKDASKVEVVGMPVRQEFLYTTKEQAREALGLSGHVVVSAFGSLGAKVMNETVADMMILEQKDGFPFHHIHATGTFGREWMPKRVRDGGVDYETVSSLDIREYIYDMPVLMAAADVVIGRSGSATCNEIAASGTPCVLVPSPNVTANHQEKNARVLEAAGGAVVILEKELTAEKLYAAVKDLLGDEDRREEMAKHLHSMVILDATERMCKVIEDISKK